MISAKELASHDGRNSCWVIIHGKVYDVTGMPVVLPQITIYLDSKDHSQIFLTPTPGVRK